MIEENPLHPHELHDQLTNQACGGYASFEGWVRKQHNGRMVTGLEYEAHIELAKSEGIRVLKESSDLFDICDCACAHRIGKLELGEIAVWVGVSATHRDAAFAACRFIIDEVKQRLPIWKKEFFRGGNTNWVNCEKLSETNETEYGIQ